jgi:hypothetical protein
LAIEKVKASKKHLRILHIFGHMLEPSEKSGYFSKTRKQKEHVFSHFEKNKSINKNSSPCSRLALPFAE